MESTKKKKKKKKKKKNQKGFWVLEKAVRQVVHSNPTLEFL
jgi:hypothetical protein